MVKFLRQILYCSLRIISWLFGIYLPLIQYAKPGNVLKELVGLLEFSEWKGSKKVHGAQRILKIFSALNLV